MTSIGTEILRHQRNQALLSNSTFDFSPLKRVRAAAPAG